MTNNKKSEDTVDWRLATWDGARREALRRWSRLPLEQIIIALEELAETSQWLADTPKTYHDKTSQVSEPEEPYSHEPSKKTE